MCTCSLDNNAICCNKSTLKNVSASTGGSRGVLECTGSHAPPFLFPNNIHSQSFKSHPVAKLLL